MITNSPIQHINLPHLMVGLVSILQKHSKRIVDGFRLIQNFRVRVQKFIDVDLEIFKIESHSKQFSQKFLLHH